MKLLILIYLFFSSASLMAGVAPCSADQYTLESINEYPDSSISKLLNGQGEIVGALIYDDGGDEFGSLYLCGSNNNYYYSRSNSLDDIKRSSSLELSAYSDEYEVDINSSRGIRTNSKMKFELSIDVRFLGDEEDADYPNFTETIYLQLD